MNMKNKPFTIAEIGINHNGSLTKAKKLIDLAKTYGFNSVKFQKRNPNVSIPESHKGIIRTTPWGQMTYLQYKKKIEFGLKEFTSIDRYCKKKKIDWFSSVFDIDSYNFIKKFRLKYNKIASSMITNLELLKIVAKGGKTTFISTGMSTLKDIERATKIFRKAKCKFVLMHCVSTYPCPINKLNLNMIPVLKKKFKCDVGYSGHEQDVSPTLLAYGLGANFIERHITLDRTMWGTDQAASLEESGVENLLSILKKGYSARGKGTKSISKEEKILLKKFKYWE